MADAIAFANPADLSITLSGKRLASAGSPIGKGGYRDDGYWHRQSSSVRGSDLSPRTLGKCYLKVNEMADLYAAAGSHLLAACWHPFRFRHW